MKLNYSLLQFLKSTTTVVVISSLAGIASVLRGDFFLPSFLFFASFQYILFTFVGNFLNNYFSYQNRQKELDKLEPLSTILECAVCKTPNVVTFVPDQNERFEFICDNTECASKNVVSINFTVARVTEFKDPIMPSPKI